MKMPGTGVRSGLGGRLGPRRGLQVEPRGAGEHSCLLCPACVTLFSGFVPWKLTSYFWFSLYHLIPSFSVLSFT